MDEIIAIDEETLDTEKESTTNTEVVNAVLLATLGAGIGVLGYMAVDKFKKFRANRAAAKLLEAAETTDN